jgi:hypothetical protein
MADRDRKILTLPYGEGLERSKGVMVVRPTSFKDLRNVSLFDGKAQVRQGLAVASVLQDDGPTDLDVTVMLEPLRSEAAAMGVGYNTTGGSNREVWLNRMLIDGTAPVAVGLLGTLDGGVTFEPPIIIGADSDNKFFIAHDEPNPTSRIVTQVYDPEDHPQLSNLQADLDGINGQRDVFFRGVVRHLSYIFGWGYGNFDDPVRGDVVRVSNSGNSRVFEDFAFFEAGQQGETVMVCRSAGPTLMVFKETETYEIFGYSPDTFGIRLADSLFGAVGSRLAVSIAGNVFFWSTQGPRVTTGGPSKDIAVPLDIGGPDPASLVAESDPQDAFAAYDPRTRVVQFVWGQRVYALSIRDPNRPRWSYYELGEVAQSSGLFFSTQSQAGGGGPPAGAPEDLVFDDEAEANANFPIQVLDGDTVTIDGKVYTYQTVLTDVDGNLQIGIDRQASNTNLFHVLNATGTPGVDYAASTVTPHPTVSSPSGGPNGILLRARTSGSVGNLIALSTTSATINFTDNRQFQPTTTLAFGVGPAMAIQVEILFENVGQIGAEDIEIHVSEDGGANYTLTGRVPANAQDFQIVTVTLESQSSGKAIQPLTDYKFSMRYILGGQFSPGYTSSDPDDWPVASQGSTTTIADPIVLRERVGDNDGLWEMLNSNDSRMNVDTILPPGHELLDINVFLTVQEAGPETSPDGTASDSDPTPPLRGDFVPGVTGPFFRATYNAASPGYPLRFQDNFTDGEALPAPQIEKLNSYQMQFTKGANVQIPASNLLQCYAGPDAQNQDAISQAGIIIAGGFFFLNLFWQNTNTPDGTAGSGGLRTCPRPTAAGVPPGDHSTKIYLRNLTAAVPWTFETVALPNVSGFSSHNITSMGFLVGDAVRVAITHKVRCFGSVIPFSNRYDSEWALTGGVRFVDLVVV